MENNLTDPQYWADVIERDILEPDKITTHLSHLRQTLRRRAPQPDALAEALKLCRAELLIRHGLPLGVAQSTDRPRCKTCKALLAADAALAAPRPERTYNAEEVVWGKRAAFVTGTEARNTDGYPLSPDEARIEAERLWASGERKDGEAGA